MKRFCTGLLCLFFFAQAIYSGTIQKIRLTEDWEFVRSDVSSLADVLGTSNASNLSSNPVWEKIALPHCFNAFDAVDPDKPYYKGVGWYRKLLAVNNPYTEGRTLLNFEGAGQKTRVYIGTELVAEHTCGYDNWSVDVTEAVARCLHNTELQKKHKGLIPLSIRCDNSHDEELIPSDLSDFNLYGGIYRPVNLVYRPSSYASQIHITPILDPSLKSARVTVNIKYNALPQKSEVQTLQIFSPEGKSVFKQTFQLGTEGQHTAHVTLKKKLKLWDVTNPQLYTCRLTSVNGGLAETIEEKFGLRHTRFEEHGPFYLNGRRLLLRGTHRHEDHAGVGAAMTDDQIRSEMLQIKAMGANFIRLGHYQQHDLVLHLCDSLGILVWEETPWCRNYVTSDIMKARTRYALTAMINHHYNHPSVLLWGMGNEVDWLLKKPYYNKDVVRSFLKEMVDYSHRLDSTRLTTLRRCDFASDILDVYSPSVWAGWYGGRFENYKPQFSKYIQSLPRVFHAEWGGDSHAGRHSEDPFTRLGKRSASSAGDWSETYIVKLFDWTLKEQETMPQLTGSAFWTFKDFSTPLRPENPIPYVNQKGVVQRDGTPKESYYVFQSYWAEAPMLHIYGHTWPVRWGKANEEKEILVYSNCPEVELFVNGRSYGLKKRNSQDFPAAGFHWNCPLQEGSNTIRAIAHTGKGKIITDEITTEYQTQEWGRPTQMRLTLKKETGDTCKAEVTFHDENNVFCPDATNFVEFGLTGDGMLLDNLGTTNGSRRIGASNGRACIRFVARGAVAISAKSGKLPTVIKTRQ